MFSLLVKGRNHLCGYGIIIESVAVVGCSIVVAFKTNHGEMIEGPKRGSVAMMGLLRLVHLGVL